MACHTYPCPGLDVEPAWATWDSAIDWVPAVSGEQFVLGGLTGLSDSSNFTGVGTVKVQSVYCVGGLHGTDLCCIWTCPYNHIDWGTRTTQ